MDCAKWIGSLVVAWLLAGSGVAVAQTPADPGGPPSLSAALETCSTSALPAQRLASFVGSMPALDGADRMQMRFELQRRRAGESMWHKVPAVEGFGIWESALPDRAGFVFHKRVDGLQVPAAYRAIVRFRWYDAAGSLVARARRVTPACMQPDLRPDLTPGSLRAVLDASPAFAIYTLTVRNDGRSPAGPFTVRVAGAAKEVAGLGAGEQIDVTILSVACAPGSLVRAVVDADRRVDEADERNALRRACPLGR
jgi:hypothetical protein